MPLDPQAEISDLHDEVTDADDTILARAAVIYELEEAMQSKDREIEFLEQQFLQPQHTGKGVPEKGGRGSDSHHEIDHLKSQMLYAKRKILRLESEVAVLTAKLTKSESTNSDDSSLLTQLESQNGEKQLKIEQLCKLLQEAEDDRRRAEQSVTSAKSAAKSAAAEAAALRAYIAVMDEERRRDLIKQKVLERRLNGQASCTYQQAARAQAAASTSCMQLTAQEAVISGLRESVQLTESVSRKQSLAVQATLEHMATQTARAGSLQAVLDAAEHREAAVTDALQKLAQAARRVNGDLSRWEADSSALASGEASPLAVGAAMELAVCAASALDDAPIKACIVELQQCFSNAILKLEHQDEVIKRMQLNWQQAGSAYGHPSAATAARLGHLLDKLRELQDSLFYSNNVDLLETLSSVIDFLEQQQQPAASGAGGDASNLTQQQPDPALDTLMNEHKAALQHAESTLSLKETTIAHLHTLLTRSQELNKEYTSHVFSERSLSRLLEEANVALAAKDIVIGQLQQMVAEARERELDAPLQAADVSDHSPGARSVKTASSFSPAACSPAAQEDGTGATEQGATAEHDGSSAPNLSKPASTKDASKEFAEQLRKV